MEKNEYISIMIQSLKKKVRILDEIMQLNARQKEELENPSLDPDDFDQTMEEKGKRIEELELLDNGFEELFARVRENLNENKDVYRDEIAEMQHYIRKLTEQSANIQVQEARNKDLMEKKFAAVKKQAKEVRKSQRVVNQYYKSMMKANYVEPQFTDRKK